MLQIKLKVSNYFLPAECSLCGLLFKMNGIEKLLFKDKGLIGPVCEGCMERGPEKYPTTLRTHAQSLRDWAIELEKMADEFIAFPTEEECQSAIKKREEWDRRWEEF